MTLEPVSNSRPINRKIWDRSKDEWYVETRKCIDQLLARERFLGTILDPCCGKGNIVNAMRDAGYDAWGSDIVARGMSGWFRGVRDFLADDFELQADNIVMNPPFFRAKGTEAFIRKAIDRTPGKVVCFASVKFLAGQARGLGLWSDHPPDRVWILSERPSCPPGAYLDAGNKAAGGTDDWAWLVWDNSVPFDSTRLGWLTP